MFSCEVQSETGVNSISVSVVHGLTGLPLA